MGYNVINNAARVRFSKFKKGNIYHALCKTASIMFCRDVNDYTAIHHIVTAEALLVEICLTIIIIYNWKIYCTCAKYYEP